VVFTVRFNRVQDVFEDFGTLIDGLKKDFPSFRTWHETIEHASQVQF
jgi:hypothetical protein